MCYIVLLNKIKNVRKINNNFYQFADIFIIITSHLLAFLSLSRAAFALIVVDIWIIRNLKNKYIFVSGLISVIIVFSFIITKPEFINKQLKGRTGKKIDITSTAEALDQRVIEQFRDFKGIAILIGKGGFGVDSSKSNNIIGQKQTQIDRKKIEVHNIFGSVLKIYGIIGLFLFIYWIIKMINATKMFKDSYYIWIALLIYNMTHNGLRFRSFWIILALILVTSNLINEKKDIKQ